MKKTSSHFKEVNNYGNDIEDHLKPTVPFTCYLFKSMFTVSLLFALAVCRLLYLLLTCNSVHVKIKINQVHLFAKLFHFTAFV